MSYCRPSPFVEGMSSLKVDNVNYRISPNTLWHVFEKYGHMATCTSRGTASLESRGFAFVRFYNKHHAKDAMNALDEIKLDGRKVRVQMAHYGHPPVPHGGRY
nr:serine/arginine-rich splicing factor 2-like [Equus asinus]